MKKQNFKIISVFLAVSFFILTGFSPLLHSHEFDLIDHTHDCDSCSWKASSNLIESEPPSQSIIPIIESAIVTEIAISSSRAVTSPSNRSPPASL
jgi:hypothetical protein